MTTRKNGNNTGKERIGSKVPWFAAMDTIAAKIVLAPAKHTEPSSTNSTSKGRFPMLGLSKKIYINNTKTARASIKIVLKQSLPQKIISGGAAKRRAGAVFFSCSLAKERPIPDMALKNKIIHKSAACKLALRPAIPVAKLTITKAITAKSKRELMAYRVRNSSVKSFLISASSLLIQTEQDFSISGDLPCIIGCQQHQSPSQLLLNNSIHQNNSFLI